MAHQLIYTSAPRLLEAGRSGFGTVARHRAVSGLLVAAVERVSQFGRSPGQNPRRVVLSHRLVHAGAASYHVFSCIRDAGSDYTGRTNHLAHHLIADAREARAAAEAGLTPADVLRQMRWLSSWTEAPRFCTPAEELSLTNFKSSPATGAWETVTQNPAHAMLPVQAQRCLLLMPGEDGSLDLFSESLALMGGFTAWLISFTTQAEPADDLADLRWLALAENSGLRSQVESASRTTFDLTQPASLPTPKLPEVKTSQVRLPDLAVETLPRRTAVSPAMAPKPLPPLFPEDEAHRPARSPWALVAAVVLAGLIGVTAFMLTQGNSASPGTAQSDSAESLIQRVRSVDELWIKYRLHLQSTRNWLKAEADESLIDAHRQSLQEIMTVLRQPLRPEDVSLPPRTQDEFTELVHQVRAWQRAVQEGVRDPRWPGDDPQEIEMAAKAAMDRVESSLGKITPFFSSLPVTPEVLPEEIQTQVLKRLSGTMAPARGTPRQWQVVLDLTRTPDTTRPSWMRSWDIAVKAAESLPAEELAELQTQLQQPDTPAWLREQIRRILLARAPATPGTATAPKPAPTLPAEPVIPADGPASPHPRFVLVETVQLPLSRALESLPTLPLEPDTQIAIGAAGAAESALTPLRQLGAPGVYRRSFNDQQPLEFHQRRLVRLPDMTAATRLVARKAGGAQIAFELIVLPQSAALGDAWPPSPGYTFGQTLDKTRTCLDAAGSRWLLSLTVVGGHLLRLQQVDDPACRYRLRADGTRVLVEADPVTDSGLRQKLAAIDQEIEVLRQGIRLDEQRRAALETSNLAQVQKEEQARRMEESLTGRQQRLLQLEEDRKALLPASPQFLGVRQGIYSFFAGPRRLCEIKIDAKP